MEQNMENYAYSVYIGVTCFGEITISGWQQLNQLFRSDARARAKKLLILHK